MSTKEGGTSITTLQAVRQHGWNTSNHTTVVVRDAAGGGNAGETGETDSDECIPLSGIDAYRISGSSIGAETWTEPCVGTAVLGVTGTPATLPINHD